MKVQLSAIFSKITSRADKSYKLEFETRELGAEAATLFAMLQTEGWLLFSPNELKEADIPDEKADPMLGTKTQAQRLRGAIYRLWEQSGKPGNSEEYYKAKMETLIEFVKDKLE